MVSHISSLYNHLNDYSLPMNSSHNDYDSTLKHILHFACESLESTNVEFIPFHNIKDLETLHLDDRLKYYIERASSINMNYILFSPSTTQDSFSSTSPKGKGMKKPTSSLTNSMIGSSLMNRIDIKNKKIMNNNDPSCYYEAITFNNNPPIPSSSSIHSAMIMQVKNANNDQVGYLVAINKIIFRKKVNFTQKDILLMKSFVNQIGKHFF